ncbi:MAG TPA: SusF/SusE family outer membrane protein [Gemmatimonadaceae bacterium]|nr:SusF/SusE family outer membrane protein [Gemmatimonadaceae bacterium]
MQRVSSHFPALLCALLLPAALVACSADNVQGPDRASMSRVPALSASDTSVELQQIDFANTAVVLSWSPGSNHGTNTAIDYALEFDTTGGTFESPIVVPLGRGMYSKAYTVAELNSFVTEQLGDAAGAKASVRVRLKSTTAAQDVPPDYSNSVSFDVTPYEPVSTTLYLIGSSAPNGWSADAATPLTPDADVPFIFSWEGNLAAGEFKFITTLGQFLPSYNRGAADTLLVYRSADSEPDDPFTVTEPGPYHITVNLIEGTISLVKQPGPPYSQLWVIGDATPNGWSLDLAAEMRQDPSDPFVFDYNEVLNVGDFKIATAKDFNAPFYRPTTNHPDLTATDVQLSAGDPDNKWYIAEAGAYKITLDLRSMKISIKKFTPYTKLWIVGDATPNGWNIDAPNEMQADPGDPYVFTYTGTLKAGEFKFPVATGDWGTDYFMPGVNHPDISSTYVRFVPGGQPDNKWLLADPGTYTITLNQLYETITIERQ